MAKKKGDDAADAAEPKTKRYSITIDDDLIRKIRILAAADDLLPPAWINNHLRRIIKETWRSTMQELDEGD